MIINVYLGYDKLLLDVCFAKFFIFRIPLIFLLIFTQFTTYKRSEVKHTALKTEMLQERHLTPKILFLHRRHLVKRTSVARGRVCLWSAYTVTTQPLSDCRHAGRASEIRAARKITLE